MKSSNFQKIGAILGLALVSLSFVGLGVWQWNRALENRRPVIIPSEIVALNSVTQPRIALPASAALRHVFVQGHFVSSLRAPHQVDGLGQESIWDVGLLQTDGGAIILAVRGLWRERAPISPDEKIEIVGILMPHQSEDYVETSPGVLRRLDSALVVEQTSKDLYDGYLIAESEKINGVAINRVRIAPPAPRSAVPGFYWQHVSYVVIWWFMAGLVLYLPFYQRRVSPDSDGAEDKSDEIASESEREVRNG